MNEYKLSINKLSIGEPIGCFDGCREIPSGSIGCGVNISDKWLMIGVLVSEGEYHQELEDGIKKGEMYFGITQKRKITFIPWGTEVFRFNPYVNPFKSSPLHRRNFLEGNIDTKLVIVVEDGIVRDVVEFQMSPRFIGTLQECLEESIKYYETNSVTKSINILDINGQDVSESNDHRYFLEDLEYGVKI